MFLGITGNFGGQNQVKVSHTPKENGGEVLRKPMKFQRRRGSRVIPRFLGRRGEKSAIGWLARVVCLGLGGLRWDRGRVCSTQPFFNLKKILFIV